ncbi:hypothetical protein [Amedibacillus sp. YH-ame10]
MVLLIHEYLNAGFMMNGVFAGTKEDFSEDGNFSPLPSNIMLNELDKKLERRKLQFVRFANDTVVF